VQVVRNLNLSPSLPMTLRWWSGGADRSQAALAGTQFSRATQRLPTRYLRSYTAPVMPKDGVIGIGLPCNHCDTSRSSFPAGSAASSFVPPVLAARRAGASPAGFTQVVAR
jgi:hypothetical protein